MKKVFATNLSDVFLVASIYCNREKKQYSLSVSYREDKPGSGYSVILPQRGINFTIESFTRYSAKRQAELENKLTSEEYLACVKQVADENKLTLV
jgi:hypothetical protein